jgi:hypothetical protein
MAASRAMRPNRIARWLAAVALVAVYGLASLGVVMGTGVQSAAARGRGRGVGRGFARGHFRGRGFGRGFGIYIGPGYYPGYYDDCWWSRRYYRWICPYY